MAKRGRPPKPTAQKIAEGNPGKRPLPENEPRPPVPESVPGCPDELIDAAREFWNVYAPLLHGCGLLTAADLAAFQRLCETEAAYRKAVTNWMADCSFSNWSMKNGELKTLLALYSRFGMTPGDRVGKTIPVSEATKKPTGLTAYAQLKGATKTAK